MRRRRALVALTAALLTAPLASPAAAVTGSLAIHGVERTAEAPTGLGVEVALQGVTTPAPVLQGARITLPAGLTWTPAAGAASGRLQCDLGAFAVASAAPSRCHPAAVVGRVEADVPESGATWSGYAMLGPPLAAGQLPSLLLEAAEGGSVAPTAPRIKLIGAVAGSADGRLDIAFDQIPAPAFSRLRFDLDGGPGALLTTPSSCGALAAIVTLDDVTTGARTAATAPVTIDQGCGAPPTRGIAAVAPASNAAGAWAPVTVVGVRHRNAQALHEIRGALPSGLLPDLNYIGDCGTFPACGPGSHVGQLRLRLGAGPAPLTVSGPVFMTPRPGGTLAGLAAVLNVRSSAVDLGTIAAAGQIVLRPTDAGLDVALTLPRTASGVPLAIQSAELIFDRQGFILHPSRCVPLGWAAAVLDVAGGVAVHGGSAQYAGCEAKPFAPMLEAALTGDTAPRGHPTVEIGLTARAEDAHLESATVRLPPTLAADLANVDNPCPLEQFNAVDCSADTRVGTAVAQVALTAEPVPGDVFLIRIPGQVLPGLGMSFTGRYAQRVVATVVFGKDNRLLVNYPGIPDLPLRRLDMTILGGSKGPLRTVAGPCKKGMVWDASFTAHGGQRSSHTIPAPCPLANAARARLTLSTTKGMRVRVLDLGGRKLQSAKVTLPAGYGFVKGRVANRRFRSLRLGVGTGRIKVLPRSVQVSPRTRSANRLDLILREGTVRGPALPRGGKKAKTVLVQVRLAFTDGTVQRQRIRVRPR